MRSIHIRHEFQDSRQDKEGIDRSHHLTVPAPMSHCRCVCRPPGLLHAFLGLVPVSQLFCLVAWGNCLFIPWILSYNPSR